MTGSCAFTSRGRCPARTPKRMPTQSAAHSPSPAKANPGRNLKPSSFKGMISFVPKPSQQRASPMRNALKLIPIVTVLGGGACHKQEPVQNEQNVAIDINSVSPNDIEELPADESSGTPSDQLANGEDSADVNDLNAASNGY